MTKYSKSDGEQLHPPIRESQIVAFETEFGYKVPAAFKKFLLAANGVGLNGQYCFPLRQFWTQSNIKSPKIYPPPVWPPPTTYYAPETVIDTVDTIKGISHTPVLSAQEKYISLQPRDNSGGFRERLPRDLLVIGYTSEGDILCLGCNGSCRDQMYVWARAWYDVSPDEALEGLQFIAESFEQFWDDLLPFEEEE